MIGNEAGIVWLVMKLVLSSDHPFFVPIHPRYKCDPDEEEDKGSAIAPVEGVGWEERRESGPAPTIGPTPAYMPG